MKVSRERISKIVNHSISTGIVSRNDTSVVFYDVDGLESNFMQVVSTFPKNTLHAVAIKANPLKKILTVFKELGAGFEAASLAEIYMALDAGAEPHKIVFDSPCKTYDELKIAIELGIHINIDSLMEIDRIDNLLKGIKSNSTFGIRVNPQIGDGLISTTSVAGSVSKFGVPLDEFEQELIECYKRYHWLTGIHVHIGSQGCPLALLVAGIKKVYNFSENINNIYKEKGVPNRISIFDIGGGLPVQYRESDATVTVEQYCAELIKSAPKLFTNEYRLITEFGRHFNANFGWAISRIEYIKKFREKTIIMTHIGADMFLRKCYNPKDWHHEILILDASGNLKNDKMEKECDIAGPLCFSGDIIARDLILSNVNEGDYVVIKDVGAYTIGMWSRYNSRQMPRVLGYKQHKIVELKSAETLEQVLGFWK